MTAGDTIDVADLPDASESPAAAADAVEVRRAASRRRRARSVSSRTPPNAHIWSSKLRENGWNISKTAEVIDTPRSNLYKKLEQYQISQETDG